MLDAPNYFGACLTPTFVIKHFNENTRNLHTATFCDTKMYRATMQVATILTTGMDNAWRNMLKLKLLVNP